MNRNITNIIAHLLWPGLLIAYIFRDRNESEFYIKQCFWLNVAASLILLIGIIPFEMIQLMCVISNIMLALCWSYSFIGAVNELEHNIPLSVLKEKFEDFSRKLHREHPNTKNVTRILVVIIMGGFVLGLLIGATVLTVNGIVAIVSSTNITTYNTNITGIGVLKFGLAILLTFVAICLFRCIYIVGTSNRQNHKRRIDTEIMIIILGTGIVCIAVGTYLLGIEQLIWYLSDMMLLLQIIY